MKDEEDLPAFVEAVVRSDVVVGGEEEIALFFSPPKGSHV